MNGFSHCSKSGVIKICVHLWLPSLMRSTRHHNTVLAPTPSLPDRKSGRQSSSLHSVCLLLFCAELCGEQWGISLPAQTQPPVSHNRSGLDFKSFRNQLFLTHPQSFPPRTHPQCRVYWSKRGACGGHALCPELVFCSADKALALTRIPVNSASFWQTVTTLAGHLASTRALEPIRPFDNSEPGSERAQVGHW